IRLLVPTLSSDVSLLVVASTEVALSGATKTLKDLGRKFDQLIIHETFDEWLHGQTDKRNIALVLFTRTREDVIHRPVGGAHVERLFLGVPFSAALYCNQA